MKHALVTGGAGFIGSHLVDHLLAAGWRVTVIDNFDPFYSRDTKLANIKSHQTHSGYRLIEADIRKPASMRRLTNSRMDVIVHLAAKAGVRPSISDPVGYHEANVTGTQNLLELARETGVKQFVFASSSSVYGVNPCVPWTETGLELMPISPYASTKLSGEFLGHVYSHLYGIRFIGLRFFTVYGPRQRPDLAIHKFAQSILNGTPITVYGDGTTRRDYTHIRDIVKGIHAAMCYGGSAFEIVNIGNNQTIELRYLISAIERTTGRAAIINRVPEQPGDVPQTWADLTKAERLLSYKPRVSLENGLRDFIDWLTKDRLRTQVDNIDTGVHAIPALAAGRIAE